MSPFGETIHITKTCRYLYTSALTSISSSKQTTEWIHPKCEKVKNILILNALDEKQQNEKKGKRCIERDKWERGIFHYIKIIKQINIINTISLQAWEFSFVIIQIFLTKNDSWHKFSWNVRKNDRPNLTYVERENRFI